VRKTFWQGAAVAALTMALAASAASAQGPRPAPLGPVMGDPTYGTGFRTKGALLSTNAQAALADLGRQALHAYLLSIRHPSSGEILRFRSELPPDLTRLHTELVRGRAESSQMSQDRG